jgi:hypothetical protein
MPKFFLGALTFFSTILFTNFAHAQQPSEADLEKAMREAMPTDALCERHGNGATCDTKAGYAITTELAGDQIIQATMPDEYTARAIYMPRIYIIFLKFGFSSDEMVKCVKASQPDSPRPSPIEHAKFRLTCERTNKVLKMITMKAPSNRF